MGSTNVVKTSFVQLTEVGSRYDFDIMFFFGQYFDRILLDVMVDVG